jgi:hypothetical protein
MRPRYFRAFGLSAALHLLAAAALVWLAQSPAIRTGSKERNLQTVVVAPSEDRGYPGLKPVDRQADVATAEAGDASLPLQIADFRVDVEKIATHAQVLFPFVTPGLSLEHFFTAPPSTGRLRFDDSMLPGHQRDPAADGGPLVLTDAALQAIVDQSWSRRDRWSAFERIRKLAGSHGANDGSLPRLLKKYCDENWLQPYVDAETRDPRLWVQLALAADHVNFISFIRRYAAAHPSTKATTELLFLLDKIAQASRDTLGVLLDSDPASRLAYTRQANPKAYRLVEQLRLQYALELSRMGLTSGASIDAYYDQVRLAILTGIVESTPDGYGADDARFLIGGIYWRAQRADDALRWWRGLSPAPRGSYAVASSQVLLALRVAGMEHAAGGADVDPSLRQALDRALRNQQGHWLMFSYDRLEHFGYRFDTY